MPPCSSLNLRLQPTQSGGDGAAAGGADADAQPSTVEAARATLQELRGGRPFTAECAGGCAERGFAEAVRNGACSHLPTGLQLGSCASPVRTCRLWAAWRSRGRQTGPLGAATALRTSSRHLQRRRPHCLCEHPGAAHVQSQRASLGAWNRQAGARSPRQPLHAPRRRDSPAAVKSDRELVEGLGAF